MYLIIFMSLSLISLILLIFSYFYDVSQDGDRLPFIKSVAWTFMFVLFLACAIDGIDFKTGNTITSINSTTTITTDISSNYNNRIMFVVFSIVCFIGFVTVMMDIRIPRG